MVHEKFQCKHWKFWASGNAPPWVPRVPIIRRRFSYTSWTSPDACQFPSGMHRWRWKSPVGPSHKQSHKVLLRRHYFLSPISTYSPFQWIMYADKQQTSFLDYASVPLGIFCIGDGEMYNYTRDASRCLAILSINTSSSDEKNWLAMVWRMFAKASPI